MPPRYDRSVAQQLTHDLRRKIVRPLTAFGISLLPALYVLYMRLVFATSRVRLNDFSRVADVVEAHDGAIGLLWHEEVFLGPYAYPWANLRPHTLASPGRAGELITRILERCGYTVFRGGASQKKGRRRLMVIREMADHMQRHSKVMYGITVDGSNGPPYRMKPGGASLARRCDKPVMLVRIWCKRSLHLPTWDRTAIPLPFNEIRYYARGPYPIPADASATSLRRFVLDLEDDLIDLAVTSHRDLGRPVPANLTKRNAEERATLLGEDPD